MRIFLALSVAVIFNTFLHSQCIEKNIAFGIDENLEYTVSYNWGKLWFDAGKATFKVKTNIYKGKTVYHFLATGTSNPSYDWFFKVNDTNQAYVDTSTLKILWAGRTSSEGGFKVFENYVFDYSVNKILSTTFTSKKPKRNDSIPMIAGLSDVLSSVYFARNIDFSKYKPNDKIPFWMITVAKTYPLYIRYLGKETITTRDGRIFNCLKFSAKLVDGTMFKGGEDLFAWVTDDVNHIAVQVDAKILIGSIKAILVKVDNPRVPLSFTQVKEK